MSDVEASSRWYQEALGLDGVHGGSEYERLTPAGADAEDFVLQLHNRETDEHPALLDHEQPLRANGVALWFRTEAFEQAVACARSAGATILDGPLTNSRAQHRELWLLDPDGYVVVVASHMGDLG